MDKEEDEDKTEAREEVEVEEVKGVRAHQGTPDTPPPDMRTSPQSRPAGATGLMESQLISVWSQAPVPGGTIGSRRPTTNEIPTSSPRKTKFLTKYINCCMEMRLKT